ncbi:MAG: hypothetical protein ACLUOI_27830 [Eisenbergiella sp.]
MSGRDVAIAAILGAEEFGLQQLITMLCHDACLQPGHLPRGYGNQNGAAAVPRKRNMSSTSCASSRKNCGNIWRSWVYAALTNWWEERIFLPKKKT